MARCVAFLRAINVGGHVVKMERLRQIFEAMGLSNVETFIASGNVIFDAAENTVQALEQDIAGRLRRALGYDVAVFMRTTAELLAIARYQPFGDVDVTAAGGLLYIGFTAQPLGPDAQRTVLSFTSAVDEFRVHEREIYWLCRLSRSSDSAFSLARLEKACGLQATFRNATTVRKMAAAAYGEGHGL